MRSSQGQRTAIPDSSILRCVLKARTLCDPTIARPGDVLELDVLRQHAAVRYRRGDKGNVLFATERCNSFCLMCSQPPRDIQDGWRVEQLCSLVELIDEALPGHQRRRADLAGRGFARVIAKCAQALPATHRHVLSNGRLLSDTRLADSRAPKLLGCGI